MILLFSLFFNLVIGQKILYLNDSLNFIALGDWGGTSNYPFTTHAQLKNAEVIKSISKYQNISFIVSTGDNFYQQGLTCLNDLRFNYTFENVYLTNNSSIEKTPWFIVAGNHDHRTKQARYQIEYTKKSNVWNFPDYLHTLKVYLKTNNMSIKIVFIDTIILCNLFDDLENSDILNETYYNILEKELIRAKNDYLIIGVGHHPIFSQMYGRTVPKCISKNLKNLLDKYLVKIYISGHDHTLQYHVYNNKYSRKSTHLFVTGSGSNVYNLPMRSNDDKYFLTKFYWKDSKNISFDIADYNIGGFSQFLIDKNTVLIKFIDSNGNILYREKFDI